MNYYDQILNKPGCACRPWPLLPATEADDEIARLQAQVAELQSVVDSLKWANEQLQMLLTVAAEKAAGIRISSQLPKWCPLEEEKKI